MIYDMFSGLDLYCTDPAQHLTTAGQDLDDLDRDLSDLSEVRKLALVERHRMKKPRTTWKTAKAMATSE